MVLALAHRGLAILGLTTVGGNVPLARSTRNGLALLEYAARSDIPLARGSSRPLRGRFGYSFGFHGSSGLTRRLPNPKTTPVPTRAADFIARRLRQSPGQITVIALGPLTNLARVLQRYPGVLDQSASLVVMGGSVDGVGNVTPHAEFNFYSDPVAARLVLESGIPLTLVDLAACRQVSIRRGEAARLKSTNPLGNLALQMLNNWFRRDPGRQAFAFYDPLALAVALDPEVVTTRQVALTVEDADAPRLGETRITRGEPSVALAQAVDTQRFFALFGKLLDLREGPDAETPTH